MLNALALPFFAFPDGFGGAIATTLARPATEVDAILEPATEDLVNDNEELPTRELLSSLCAWLEGADDGNMAVELRAAKELHKAAMASSEPHSCEGYRRECKDHLCSGLWFSFCAQDDGLTPSQRPPCCTVLYRVVTDNWDF